MLEDVGLFDERFGSYYEDVDLAWRAQLRGWPARYIPSAVVRHAHSATGSRFPARKRFLIGRNRLWTLLKNTPRAGLGPALGALPAVEGALSIVRLLRGDSASMRGRLAALAGIGPVLRQRQFIQRRAVVGWAELVPLLRSGRTGPGRIERAA